MSRSRIVGKNIELLIKCKLIDLLPKDITEILNFLFKRNISEKRLIEIIKKLPRHPFFKCKNWANIGNPCLSFISLNYIDRKNLLSISQFKNYEQEIDLFLDWINPYIDASRGRFIGWKWCEGYNFPKLIYKKRLRKQHYNKKFNIRCTDCNSIFEETLKRRQRRNKVKAHPICPECIYRNKTKITFKNEKIKFFTQQPELDNNVLTTGYIIRKFKITPKAAKQWIDNYNTLNDLLKKKEMQKDS